MRHSREARTLASPILQHPLPKPGSRYPLPSFFSQAITSASSRRLTAFLRGCLPHLCTDTHAPASNGVLTLEAISVMWIPEGFGFYGSLSAVRRHRLENSERPGRQHVYVHCRNCDCRGYSLWFWFHRDRLGRMVLQRPKTTRLGGWLRISDPKCGKNPSSSP